MKYIKLWGRSISMNKTTNFKWEWSVHYEFLKGKSWSAKDGAGQYVWEQRRTRSVESRRQARVLRVEVNHMYAPGRVRNVVMKRRLVQVDWQTYE